MFLEGSHVKYKECYGVIAFVSNTSVSILIKEGNHKSQDCRIVVHSADFNKIEILDEK